MGPCWASTKVGLCAFPNEGKEMLQARRVPRPTNSGPLVEKGDPEGNPARARVGWRLRVDCSIEHGYPAGFGGSVREAAEPRCSSHDD